MVPDKGASGDFDYLREEPEGSDGVDVVEAGTAYASEADLDYLLGEVAPTERNGFDAFDENTWGETLAPVAGTPWHRSPQARTLLIASAAALSAIVVSVVLLVLRGPSDRHTPMPADSSTAVTTPLATASSEMPPPPPPLPPPPPPEPSAVNQAPAIVRPTVRPRPTKPPEINVTRTPQTRLPISVAPQQRKPR
jgi:hypothetical protein